MQLLSYNTRMQIANQTRDLSPRLIALISRTVEDEQYRLIEDVNGQGYTIELIAISKLNLKIRRNNVTDEEWIDECTGSTFNVSGASGGGILDSVDNETITISSNDKKITQITDYTMKQTKGKFPILFDVYYEDTVTHTYEV